MKYDVRSVSMYQYVKCKHFKVSTGIGSLPLGSAVGGCSGCSGAAGGTSVDEEAVEACGPGSFT